jgi:hypothetical protein
MTQSSMLRMRAVCLIILATMVFGVSRVAEQASTAAVVGPSASAKATLAAVAGSILLAAALWRWDTSVIWIAATEFALVFAALDLRETFHQIHVSRLDLATLALLAAVLHGRAAVVAARQTTAGRAGRRSGTVCVRRAPRT